MIETLLWTVGDGYALLPEHLARLARSAAELGFALDEDAVRERLDAAPGIGGADRLRVRLELPRGGRIQMTATPEPAPGPGKVWALAVSPHRFDPNDRLLRHKTTLRDRYDPERRRLAALTGCDEALFLNARDEVCEGSFTTIFADLGAGKVTPPVVCGLLPGTLRARLLAEGRVRERILRLDDLRGAREIWIGNSVRGLIPARLSPAAENVS